MLFSFFVAGMLLFEQNLVFHSPQALSIIAIYGKLIMPISGFHSNSFVCFSPREDVLNLNILVLLLHLWSIFSAGFWTVKNSCVTKFYAEQIRHLVLYFSSPIFSVFLQFLYDRIPASGFRVCSRAHLPRIGGDLVRTA